MEFKRRQGVNQDQAEEQGVASPAVPPPESEPVGRVSLRTLSKSLAAMSDAERHDFWSSEMKKGAALNDAFGYAKVDKAIAARCEALRNALRDPGWSMTGNEWAKPPKPWMVHVLQVVAAEVYGDPSGVSKAAAVHLRLALREIADPIWMKAGSMTPEHAARYHRREDRVQGRDSLLAWAAAHSKHQAFFEDRATRHLPGADETTLLEEGYMDYVDRVAIHFCEAMRSGPGAVNPNIPLDSDGMPRKFTDLGGYPLYYVTKDSGVLSPEAVIENLSLTNDPDDPQWYVVRAEVNYEDQDLVCDHTGQRIPSAYSPD